MENEKLLTANQVGEILGMTPRHIRILARKQSDFPQPIRFNCRRLRWKPEAISDYIRSRGG